MKSTQSFDEELRALIQQGVPAEEAARKLLDGEKSDKGITQSKAPTDENSLSFEDEVAAAMHLDDQGDDTPTLTALLDPITHRRVQDLAKKRHHAVHRVVRDLVRTGLSHTV